MYWNHRVFKIPSEYESCYEIREVYYNEDGTIHGTTVHAVAPRGNSIESLKKVIGWMLQSTEYPILEEDKIQYVYYEDGDPDPDEIY
ncbi:MAG: hypothetical protein QXL17_02815 [Candidatus Thermoplasmatota archaeon]